MTRRFIPILSLALPLLGAAPALAGPGSLPAYLLPPPAQGRADAPYALTGRTREEPRRFRNRAEWIGGGRAQRDFFVQVEPGERR